jgi:hypothetical protein
VFGIGCWVGGRRYMWEERDSTTKMTLASTTTTTKI